MRSMSLLFATTVLAVTGLGCGDDDGGGGSGVSGSKKLGDLTSSEVRSLCNGVKTRFERMDEAFISISCTELSYGEDTCKADVQDCIENPPNDDDPFEAGFTCENDDGELECPTITVKEFEGCIEAMTRTFENMADEFTCTSNPTTIEPPSAPKACTDLGSRCENLSSIDFEAE
jgi:hypothetical protein